MCGILASFGTTNIDENAFRSVLKLTTHRGPDDTGALFGDGFALGHNRLSIVDVAGGHQPLSCSQAQLYGVSNGEIYNHRNIRDRNYPDYPYKTRSDAEVLLPAFRKKGAAMVADLDGMFAFVLTDGRELLAARDPLGIKPLYYGHDGDQLYFGSEIKTLIPLAKTIREFPQGHFYHSKTGFQPYYTINPQPVCIHDEAQAIREIRRTLETSVRKRLMSDVPVGVFRSGGLDSSIIAALMRQSIPELHSFSVGVHGSPDLEAARKVANHIGTIHHEYVYTEDEMIEVLPDVINHLESFDPALVRSAVPCYMVSRLAARHVKVVLSGEGADELFGGYSYFSQFKDSKDLRTESIRILNGLHNMNLQRVDRMTMAHSLEGRVPFLDIDFIETVLKIDPELKLHGVYPQEKGLLRKAVEDLLPREIVWRKKMEFAQGCGSSRVLEQMAEKEISQETLDHARSKQPAITGKESLYYFNLFKNRFDHPDAVGMVATWNGTLH